MQFAAVHAHDLTPAYPAPVMSQGAAVTRLALTDFRNYADLRLDVGAAPVVLVGANGAGKTNLLEALSLLAPGRGLRRARLGELARRNADGSCEPGRTWSVAVRGVARGCAFDVGTGLEFVARATEADDDHESEDTSERRVVRIDGRTAAPAALTHVAAVRWLTPQMDRLFQESAATRRRWLDHLAAGLDGAHASRVSSYERTLRQRSKLLRERNADARWLKALEGTLAELGVAIAAARREYVAQLNLALGEDGAPIARIVAAGDVEDWLAQHPALEAESRFRDALAAGRERDAIVGGSEAGPHRSDLAVWRAASGLPAAQCSTGEQKSLVFAIVRADARLLAANAGGAPLLLLDEVAAHLDEARRAELFEAATGLGAQVWATGTDRASFQSLEGRAQFVTVAHGSVTGR